MTGKELLDKLSALDHNELKYQLLFCDETSFRRIEDFSVDFDMKTLDLKALPMFPPNLYTIGKEPDDV